MVFTDLGFLFLLMPMSAVLYYCFSKKLKPMVLFCISALFLYLIEPSSIWLFALMLPDFFAVSRYESIPKERAATLFRVLILKNIIIMLYWGIGAPMLNRSTAPRAIMVICLSSIELMVYRKRGDIKSCGFFEAAGSVSFFGKLFYGPVNTAQGLIRQISSAKPSVSMMARGIMMIICGVSKRVILAEQFFALFKTIARMPVEQYSMLLGWICALCGALGLYFTLSGFSDIAAGLGAIFSLKLPRMLYYPFQAENLREYIYRINISLEDSIGRLMFTSTRREDYSSQGYLVSFMMPLMLGMWISPSGGFLLWSIYLCGLVALDWLLLRRLPAPIKALSCAATFVITLPSYVLLLATSLSNRANMLAAMIGFGGFPIINDEAIYLISSNFLLFAIGIPACSSAFDILSRATEKQFPQFWWIASCALHLALMALSTSFLLWNVR